MAKQLMYVTGNDGQIELLDDRVIIHRKGILNIARHGINARREIAFGSISSVNFRDATMFRMGEIDFDYAGRSQTDKRQNTVMFSKKHHDDFFRLKEKLFELMNKQRK